MSDFKFYFFRIIFLYLPYDDQVGKTNFPLNKILDVFKNIVYTIHLTLGKI